MKQDIKIKTEDGVASASIFRGSMERADAKPGVIFYMDAIGPRPSLDDMAQRLADAGHVVLLPDLFYRFAPYGPFGGPAFSDPTSREQIMKMLGGTTQDMTRRDTAAFIEALLEAGAPGARSGQEHAPLTPESSGRQSPTTRSRSAADRARSS